MKLTEHGLRLLIREALLNEIDIEEVGESCWTAGSTHELATCSIGGDQFYLKFSDTGLFESDDPSLQILNEYLAYQIYKLYPDAATPNRIELVYDKSRGRVGLASAAVRGGGGRMISPAQLASLLSAGVYVDIFLANWDISNRANIIVSPESDKATRIDLGGNLDFRAQGKRKGRMFGDDPGELETMLPTSGRKITDIFVGADLRAAAQTFLGTPWTAISGVITATHQTVLEELQTRGMERLAGEWDAYVKHVAPILAKRHKTVMAHAQHILDTGPGVTEARLRRFISEALEADEEEDDSYFSDYPGRPAWMPDIPSDVMTTVSSKPIPAIRDTSRQCGYGRKPRGLWYAPGTAWIDWMQYEMPDWLADVNHVYTLQPIYAAGGLRSQGGVLQLQTPKEMMEFTRRFAVEGGREINWPAVVEIWDGVEIIPAQFDMANNPSTFWYWGWDIPSGCIWRPEGAADFKLLASKGS